MVFGVFTRFSDTLLAPWIASQIGVRGRIRWWILGDRGDTRAGCYLAGWLGVAGRGRSADLGSLLSLAAGSSNAGTF